MAKKSSSNEDVEVSKRFKKEVKVSITAEEITDKDHQIRKNLTKIANLNEDMRPLKDKVKALVEENKQLRIDCEDETESKTIYVVNEFHFTKNKVIVKRDDNGEVVEERVMTTEERQELIPDAGIARGKGGEGEGGEDDGLN